MAFNNFFGAITTFLIVTIDIAGKDKITLG